MCLISLTELTLNVATTQKIVRHTGDLYGVSMVIHILCIQKC